MKLLLCIALILNLIIIVCEIWTISKIRNKIDVIKYYTFLQNFLALISSIVFSIYLICNILFNVQIPEYVRGIRYVTTCGLVATTFIYTVFLSSKSKNLLTEKDFLSRINPKCANIILHYFCPFISLVSFVLFERQILLVEAKWTGYAAIPSCLYWGVYLILSITNLWEEPYDFSKKENNKKNSLLEKLTMILLPLSFILISYVLWNIK